MIYPSGSSTEQKKKEPSQAIHAWKRHAPKSIGNKAWIASAEI